MLFLVCVFHFLEVQRFVALETGKLLGPGVKGGSMHSIKSNIPPLWSNAQQFSLKMNLGCSLVFGIFRG